MSELKYEVMAKWNGKNFKSLEPCACCGHDGEDEQTYHHIYTRGSHPELTYVDWNCVSLCSGCHVGGVHQYGEVTWSEMCPAYKRWLLNNGWYLSEFPKKKWNHEC